jgi:hypothetical protein
MWPGSQLISPSTYRIGRKIFLTGIVSIILKENAHYPQYSYFLRINNSYSG